MRTFNEKEIQQIDDILQRLESQSSMECVLVCYPRSGSYPAAGFWLGNALLWCALIVPEMLSLHWDMLLTLLSALLAQLFGMLLGWTLPPLNRLLGSAHRMRRQCEITARAIFHKARLFQTSRQSGFLVFISFHEQQVVLLWDLGIDMKIPMATLRKWEMDFQAIFRQKDVALHLTRQLESLTITAKEHMPAILGNANELPNRLNVKL